MRKVLIVAYYFPPIGGIGSIRMGRFAECLPRFGWDPTVLAPRDTPHPQDPRLVASEDRVIRARSFEVSRLGRALPRAQPGGAGDPAGGGVGLGAAIRRHAMRLVFPDAQIGWYPDAVRRGARALAGGDFDVIYSSSYPMTAHLVARSLHRRSGVPWVAELRDPWSDRFAGERLFGRTAVRLERSIATEADRVVVPSPTWARFYASRWGREVEVLPNGHDLEASVGGTGNTPTIAYLGTYYPDRQNLRAVWAAVRRLRESGEGVTPRVRFIGELPAELATELDGFGLSDLVEATGFLPHDAAMRAMQTASLLIASGFADDGPLARGVIPAKVFEYLASGLPILYVGRAQDDAWGLLAEEPGCWIVSPDDVTGAVVALRSGLHPPGHYERDAQRHSRLARAEALARILDGANRRQRRA